MRTYYTVLLLVLLKHLQSQSSGVNNALRFLMEESGSQGFNTTLLVQGNPAKLQSASSAGQFTLNYAYGDIASITCNVNIIPSLLNKGAITYAEYIIPRKKIMSDTMVYRNRIKQVKLWTAPLPQAYNGEGVLMGIVDTGIDFTHPDFKDSLGKTRVLNIWDQAATTGSGKPQPYNYGIEWNSAQINNNQCTHSDLQHFGHGTHVSGIAAGNGLANGRNEGIASKSQLLVVAVDLSRAGPTIADAINYVFSKATSLGRPCVVNVSLGDYYGSHDATDLEARLIETMLKNSPGRAVVAAVGNAGHIRYHVRSQPPSGDTVFTWLNSGGSQNYWCYGDTQQVKQLRFSFGANQLSFQNINQTPFRAYNFALPGIRRDTVKNSAGQRIGVINLSASINNYGVYELSAYIASDSANVYWRVETTGQGLHHAWNFGFLSSGLPSVTSHPRMSKYAMPDTTYGMVSSFQCSEEVITVGNYVNLYNYYDVNNNLQSSGQDGGEIAYSSSPGPTRRGLIKPDVSASGQTILSAVALGMKNNLITNAPTVVGQGSMHVAGGGSSSASPIVAGLAALYLQKHPGADNRQVRDAIRYCAYNDANTGTNLPDYRWGFGKLDGKAAMTCGEGNPMVSLKKNGATALQVFPNPFNSELTLNTAELQGYSIKIYDGYGRLVYQNQVTSNTHHISAGELPADCYGILLLQVSKGQNQYQFKILKSGSAE